MNFNANSFFLGMIVLTLTNLCGSLVAMLLQRRRAMKDTERQLEYSGTHSELRARARAVMLEQLTVKQRTDAANLQEIVEFIDPMSPGCLSLLLKYPPGYYVHKGRFVLLESYFEGAGGVCDEVSVSEIYAANPAPVKVRASDLLPVWPTRAPTATYTEA